MIEASAHDRILVLHSSCTENDDEEASPSEGTSVTTGNDTANHGSAVDLLEETIFCNLFFLPEHPSDVVSKNDYLHLPNNPLNPCGMSNVLTLEMLPTHWIEGPILLSLSSCQILYHDNNNGGGDEVAVPIALFVEPTPSTFVLDFSIENDLGDNTQKNRNRNENVMAVNQMSEIHVVFDVREASMQAAGLVRHKNATTSDSEEDEGRPRIENDLEKQCEDHQLDDNAVHKEDTTYNDHRFSLENVSTSPTFDESIARHNVDDREMMIRNLNARLNQGSETIDLILFMSGFFSLLSLTVLLWAIYQFYRTNKKSDQLSQDIRHGMKKSHDMLQTAVEEMTAHNDRTTESRNRSETETNDERNHQYRDTVSSLVDEPDKDRHECQRNHPTTPKRDETEEGHHDKNENNQTPVRLFSAAPSLVQKEKVNQLCFIRPADRNLLCETKNVELEAHLSPCSGLTSDSMDGESLLLHVDRKLPSVPLSPCSQIEKEWNESKTIRRSNVKKRRPFLKPKFHSKTGATATPSNTPCKTSEDITTTAFRVPSNSERIDGNQRKNQEDHSCTILDPPKLRSSLLDETVENPALETERKEIAGSKTPPLHIVSQKPPPMCYTPASEDDSFVDDYW